MNRSARVSLDRSPGHDVQPVTCELWCRSASRHLAQLYAGFAILSEQGLIKVRMRRSEDYKVGKSAGPLLTATIDGRCHVAYDTWDDCHIDPNLLERVDFYFKRSYDADSVEQTRYPSRVFPLGLFYTAYADHDWSTLMDIWNFAAVRDRDMLFAALRHCLHGSYLLSRLLDINNGRYVCDYKRFEELPSASDYPTVMFFARLWDPRSARSTSGSESLMAINQMRVECIQKLTSAFGDRFIGGLEPTPYALEKHSSLVVRDRSITRKNNYLEGMKKAEICITTMGVLGSNGAKLGEYVAASRAIVTERLRYLVPGGFGLGNNYLEFNTSDGCVEAALDLSETPDKRLAMMRRNKEYYDRWLRPDRLIWNSLELVRGERLSEHVY